MNEIKTKLKNVAIDSIESMADFYEKTADEIWDNPELSLKEFGAAKLYCDTLRAEGFEVEAWSSPDRVPEAIRRKPRPGP